MGIDLTLHSKPGQSIDPQELAERLIKAGANPYPEDPDYDTNGYFMLPGIKGHLRIVPEIYNKEGEWAWVRLSWTAGTESWKQLLDIAEQIKGRIYDSNLDQYITYEMIDDVMEHYSFGVDMLGKAGKKEKTMKNSDDKDSETTDEQE